MAQKAITNPQVLGLKAPGARRSDTGHRDGGAKTQATKLSKGLSVAKIPSLKTATIPSVIRNSS